MINDKVTIANTGHAIIKIVILIDIYIDLAGHRVISNSQKCNIKYRSVFDIESNLDLDLSSSNLEQIDLDI